MKWHIPLLGLALGVVGAGGPAVAGEPLPLRVLYVGQNRDRGTDYEAFLKQHFAKVTVAPRKGFDPAAARDVDVVLLDWSQSEDSVDKASSPSARSKTGPSQRYSWAAPGCLWPTSGN